MSSIDMPETRDVEELRILKRNGFFGTITPVMSIIRGSDAQASINFSTPFFIADRDYEVLAVTERHEVAASDGSFTVRKVPSGTAPASGTALLSSQASLTGTANTNQSTVLTGTLENRRIASGDSLALEANGLLTSLSGVSVSVLLKAI